MYGQRHRAHWTRHSWVSVQTMHVSCGHVAVHSALAARISCRVSWQSPSASIQCGQSARLYAGRPDPLALLTLASSPPSARYLPRASAFLPILLPLPHHRRRSDHTLQNA